MTQDVNPFVMDTTGLSCCSAALCPEQCDKQAPGNREGGGLVVLPACLLGLAPSMALQLLAQAVRTGCLDDCQVNSHLFLQVAGT